MITWGSMREVSIVEAVIANIMKGVILLGVLVSVAHCETPKPVEHDPGAWGFTTMSATLATGTFTKPSIGFAAGVVIGVVSNHKD